MIKKILEGIHDMVEGLDYVNNSEFERADVLLEDAEPAPQPTSADTQPARRESSLREELVNAGLTQEQIRERLNAYTASTSPNNRAMVARSAIRFVTWFESGMGVAPFAKSEGVSTVGLQATIKRLSAVALSETYDGVNHGLGDLLSDSALLTPKPEPEQKQPLKSGMGEVRKTTKHPDNPYDPAPQDHDDDSELAWQSDALCAQTDPEAFFPEKGGSTRDAKKICTTCDVKEECLDYALANDERFGIWGGLSERERRKLRKQGATA